MREDTCANCGKRIFLIKRGPNLFRWVSDLDKPDATERCDPDTLGPPAKEESGVLPRHHAPVSMRESHR